MNQANKPFSPAWLVLWSAALGMAWLLPNHYPPWTTFHSEAWAAMVMQLALFPVFLGTQGPVRWHAMPLAVLLLLPVPMLQHWFGLLPFIGDAWMASAYLLGLLLALHVGTHWEASSPGQAMDGLALAFGLAGTVSVAIQLIQWLGVGNSWISEEGAIGWKLWIVDHVGGRPYANFGQPNLLGTLLLWSVLSVAWGVHRRKIGTTVGVLLALYLLFGVALTQSRTSWLGVGAIVAASWYWASIWPSRRVPITVSTLGLFFVIVTVMQVMGISWTSQSSSWQIDSSRVEGGLRPAAWWLFTRAALAKPWFGYGWDQVMVAYLAMASHDPPLFGVFTFSHNLFLDLLLWWGIPIGLLVSALLVTWSIDKFRRVAAPDNAIILLFLVIVGIHAMLEFPLHHAYFLLPAGVLIGMLDSRVGGPGIAKTARSPLLALGVGSAVLFGVIVSDYLGQLEQNFLAMRFESARIGSLPVGDVPEVIVLTHMREWLRLARFDPHSAMSERDIQWVSDVAQRYPMPDNLFKLAQTLALNGRPKEASEWLLRTRQVISPLHWKIILAMWIQASRTEPKMAAVDLPPPFQ